MPERIDKSLWKAAEAAVIEGNVARLEGLFAEHPELAKAATEAYVPKGPAPDYAGGSARAIIVQEHHFQNFEEFTKHFEALKQPHSPTAQFEQAVEAIISGDIDTLQKLLRARP